MASNTHIVVVDDDHSHRDLVAKYLAGEGYRVSVASDGCDLRQIMASNPADIALLDIVLPDEDGYSLARFLRAQHNCGIIMLTIKSEVTDRIVGLEVGADDFLSKPFELRELLARIRSLARRLERAPPPMQDVQGSREIVSFDQWSLDLGARRLANGTGAPVELTTGEFKLLCELISKPEQIFSREELLLAVHNRDWDYFDRSIDVLVTRLRSKLETDKRHPAIIKTVRGAGYVFAAPLRRHSG